MKLQWVIPETEGGVGTYSAALWPAVRDAAREAGFETADPLVVASGTDSLDAVLEALVRSRPDLLHVQHEFGLFGGKLPFRYRWPAWVRAFRVSFPDMKIVATAHSVLGPNYRYNTAGRPIGALARAVSNYTWVPFARRLWLQGSWGGLDGVIVHSGLQKPVIEGAGCLAIEVIPHYVLGQPVQGRVLRDRPRSLVRLPEGIPTVGVFGYFTPEKGQDVVIAAMPYLKSGAHLILGGGVRRREDKAYELACREQAEQLGVKNRVHFAGFLSAEKLFQFFSQVDLVVAPFRETSGSGSIASAFTQGAVVLGSDLPLNLELAERVPDALAFFRSEDPRDCARRIDELLGDAEARKRLRVGGTRYAEICSPRRMALEHAEFYSRIAP